MSEQTKTYAPVSVKQITFQTSGKTILKLGINVEKLTAFLKHHANAKGFVNLGISARKETSQYGETHTVWLDTWKPDEKRATGQPEAKEHGFKAPPPRPAAPSKTPYAGKQDDDGQVPF